MRQTVRRCGEATGGGKRALLQAGRELLLAQASDWAFMIRAGTTGAYASRRVKTHLLRMHRLCREAETGDVDEPRLAALESQNNLFPRLPGEVFR